MRKAGGFWALLWIYNEEVDLSIRMIRRWISRRLLRRQCRSIIARAVTGGRSKMYWYYQIRNRIWICYRYYPLKTRVRKITVYSAVYLLKGMKNFQLLACLRGLAAGLRNWRIVRDFPDKLTPPEMSRLESLNPRRSVQWGQ